MPRRIVACLAALGAAATLSLVAAATPLAGAAQAADPTTDPLQVTVDSITPGVIPSKGPIRIEGVVTNVDDETWTTINVYSFISDTPMTTQAELAAAVELPADAPIGDRIADDPDARATIDELAPGQSVPFAFSVPRARLEVTEAGVYWFGVHALGQGPDGRDDVTDGRARTFLPLVKPAAAPLPTSVVIPLRHKIAYAADGSLDDLDEWVDTLGEGGRLSSLVDLGLSAGSRAVSYLVDPALVDAMEQLAAGNPARSLRPTIAKDSGDEGDSGSGASPATADSASSADGSNGSDASDSSDGSDGSDGSGQAAVDPDALEPAVRIDPLTAQAQTAAVDWLDRLGRALPGHEILGLPYGDIDVAGAADNNSRSYAAARKRTGTELAPFSLPVDPVVAAPGGFLDDDGLSLVDDTDTVVISDAMFAPSKTDALLDTSLETDDVAQLDHTDEAAAVPTVASDEGHRIVVTSSASTTGPGPGEARSALSLRQRTLAEAAVRTGGADPQPLVVMLPNDWNPADNSDASDFFSAFDVDWLDLVPLGEIAALPATPISLGDLTYPRFQERTELGTNNFTAAGDLSRAGDQLQNLLTRNDQVGRTIRDEALTTLSYTARSQATTARLAATASTRWIDAQLSKVHIEAPPAVTMTGTSGRFTSTIVNDLHQPVTVGLDAQVNEGIEISHPRTVAVPAAAKLPGKARVLLVAKSPGGGIHSVKLSLTDTDGTAIGGADSLRIRSLQVSRVIWLFIIAALALLFAAIAFRLVRRVRAARRTPREPDGPEESDGPDDGDEGARPSAPTGASTGAGDTAEPRA